MWVDIIQSFEGLYRIKRQSEDEISLCSWVGTSIFPALGHQSRACVSFAPRRYSGVPPASQAFCLRLSNTMDFTGLHLANGRLGDSLAITIWANSYNISQLIYLYLYIRCIYIYISISVYILPALFLWRTLTNTDNFPVLRLFSHW